MKTHTKYLKRLSEAKGLAIKVHKPFVGLGPFLTHGVSGVVAPVPSYFTVSVGEDFRAVLENGRGCLTRMYVLTSERLYEFSYESSKLPVLSAFACIREISQVTCLCQRFLISATRFANSVEAGARSFVAYDGQ